MTDLKLAEEVDKFWKELVKSSTGETHDYCHAATISKNAFAATVSGLIKNRHSLNGMATLLAQSRELIAALRRGPEPWQRTRREVLIEAAMKCRDIQYEHLGPPYDTAAENVKSYHNGMAKGADVCEYAIRELAERPPSGEMAVSRNYVADREVEPTKVTFANGRIVRSVGGYLVVE